MSEAEIKAVADKLADVARVLRAADPDDKAEIFRQLGLRLTYHPGRQLVQAQIEIPHWQIDGVRGRIGPIAPYQDISYSDEIGLQDRSTA
jgi:site-specific DNA recombinase